MQNLYKKAPLIFCFILFAFQNKEVKPITIWMIGDSTMSIKDTKNYPETGWGMPFVHFFDSTVRVENHAKNGRSSGTFITEKLWEPVANTMREGDYLIIQFGHNDEVVTKKSYTTKEQFRSNLIQYVDVAKSKKVKPILMTSAARRSFDSTTGKVVGTHDVYAAIVRSVAKEKNVPLIDLDTKSQALLQQMGVENSKLLFNQLLPGEHPNYPKGVIDNTHFNELGARMMAQLVLKEMKALQLELVDRLAKK